MKKLIILLFLAGAMQMCSSSTQGEKQSLAIANTEQGSQLQLEIVGEFASRPGNVVVSQDGRVFTTMHPLDPVKNQLVEVIGTQQTKPFPGKNLQKNGAEANDDQLDTPLGVRVDKNNVLWTIDMGQNLGKTRLFGFDINTNQEVFRFEFPVEIAPKGSFIQDLAVDERNGWIYLADIADAGILAVNMKTLTVRRFSHTLLEAEDIDMVIDGKVIYFGGEPARVAVNPITLSEDRETLYFGAMNGTKWYSLPAQLFRKNAADPEIAAAIKVVGDKPISDGAATDASGHHYFTNLQEHGLDLLTPQGVLKPFIRDQRIIWPDNVSVSGGYAYFVVNQLHTVPAFTGSEDIGKPPYYIYRVKI